MDDAAAHSSRRAAAYLARHADGAPRALYATRWTGRADSTKLTPLAPVSLATSVKSSSTSISQLPSSHCRSARTALRLYSSDLSAAACNWRWNVRRTWLGRTACAIASRSSSKPSPLAAETQAWLATPSAASTVLG